MAELKIMPVDGPVGYKTIPMDRPLLIGSGEDCDIRIKGSGIRPEHCRIGFKKNGFYIETIDGAREVKLNGSKVEVARLKADDDISVGKHRLVLKLKAEDEQMLAKFAKAEAEKAAAVYYKPFYQGRLFQGIAVGLVVLTALAIWLFFDYRRRSSEKAFDAAFAEFTGGAHQQAIKSFDKFLTDYPSSPNAAAAKFYLGYAAVRQHSDGAAPVWKSALDEAKTFINDFEKHPMFTEQSKEIADTLARIAAGLATAAGKTPDPDALVRAAEAVKLIEDSFSKADRPEEKMSGIQTLMTEAKIAIEKDGRRKEALEKMNAALAGKRPIDLYREHQKLYRSYPDLKTDRVFASLRQKAGEIEREQVVFEAAREGSPPPPAAAVEAPARTMVFRRAAESAKKSGNVDAVQVADAVYAFDTGSGEVLWRLVVGFEPAFPPVVVRGAGVLIHLPAEGVLALVDPVTAKPKWRQSVRANAPAWSCTPLVQNNLIYFFALDAEKSEKARMLVHRLDDGKPVGQFVFPQRVTGSPAYDPDRRAILVVGQQVSLYSIDASSRQCDALMVLDHEAEAVACPPVFRGRFLFLSEQVKADQSRLRCLVLTEAKAEARQKQSVDLRGLVWREPFIQFGKLFITTDLNRFAAYDIADEKDDKPLNEVLRSADVLEAKGDQAWPFAPNPREFWIVGQKLSAYDLRSGPIASAPLWEVNLDGPPLRSPVADAGQVVIASRTATGSVSVVALDANTHKETWKIELGKQPGAAALDPADPNTLLVSVGEGAERLRAEELAVDKIVEAPLPPEVRTSGRPRKPVQFRTLREWTDGVLQWSGVGGRQLAWLSPGGQRAEYTLRSPIASRPLVLGQSVLVPARDGLLYSIDPKTGKESAEPYVGPYSKEGQPIPMGPIAALDGKSLIAVSGQKIVKLELSENATPPFFREEGSVEVAAAAIDHMIGLEGQLLIAYAEELAALDPASMRLTNKWPIGSSIVREPAALAGVVVLTTASGELLCVGRPAADKPIDLRWRARLEGEPAGAAAADRHAWVVYANGNVQRIDLQTGRASAGPSFGRFIVDGPWMAGDRIVALTPDGSLASVPKSDGKGRAERAAASNHFVAGAAR